MEQTAMRQEDGRIIANRRVVKAQDEMIVSRPDATCVPARKGRSPRMMRGLGLISGKKEN